MIKKKPRNIMKKVDMIDREDPRYIHKRKKKKRKKRIEKKVSMIYREDPRYIHKKTKK